MADGGNAWGVRTFSLLCVAAGCYAVAVALGHMLRQQTPAAWLVPLASGGATALLGLLIAATESARARFGPFGSHLLTLSVMVLYAAVLHGLGFLLASILFVVVIASVYSRRHVTVYIEGMIVVFALWALFTFLLPQSLPPGAWL